MTDKEKLIKIKSLADKMYYAANLTTDASLLRKAMDDYYQFLIYEYHKEEPASEKFAFKSIPRLLEMIEPTDRAKAYCQKLIDSLEQEGYSIDAKIARNCLKQMNGEKVAIATMDEEPVSDELEKVVEEIVDPTVLNAYGVKEIANRLRRTMIEPVSEDLGDYINELSKQFPDVSFAKLSRIAVRVAKWQEDKDKQILNEEGVIVLPEEEFERMKRSLIKLAEREQQIMAKAIDGVVTFDYYGDDDKTYGCIAHDSFCLEDFGLKDRDKVKVIVIKED